MDKYETIKAIGRGSYGNVYLYKRKSDQRQVVIKQIAMESLSSEAADTSHTEIKVLSLLKNPYVIQYHESFQHDSAINIVMEYAPGGNLHAFLEGRKPSKNFLGEQSVLSLFTQIVLGLDHIHKKNILHRDLKTHNIFLNKTHNNLKIGDFGISKILASKSKAHTVVGTPCYLSPELCKGKPYNQKSDIWALGCVLYELLTLKRAFHAESIPALIIEITEGKFPPISDRYSALISKLVNKLLHLEPKSRPDTKQILAESVIFPVCMKLQLNLGIINPNVKPIF